ncbi:MAG: hypothetical protein IJ635_00620 [Bacteroidaceae bacterium]|nr:hypothetical protein [Bacteroidaceae bacterium]
MDKRFYETPEFEVIDLLLEGELLLASGEGEDDGGAAGEGGAGGPDDFM